MKIARINIYEVDLPVRGGVYKLSGGRDYKSFTALIAHVITECGLEGWGESTAFGGTYIEAFPEGILAGLKVLAPMLLGQDPRQTDVIYSRMDHTLMGQRGAKAALDIACWDIRAKAAGLPLCEILGGRIEGPVGLISSIPTDTPEAMRKNVAQHREKGFRAHSIKIGPSETEGGPALDIERILAVQADRKSGEWFLSDANGGLSVEHGLRIFAGLPKGTELVLEAPCASFAETARLRQKCPYPILLDELIQTEADLILAIKEDLCDGVGLKVTKQGGVTPMMRQRIIATAAGLVMSIQDTVGSEISFATILHIAQSTDRNLLRFALDTRAMVDKSIGSFDPILHEGGLEAPKLPGLGVTPDLARLGAPIAHFGENG